MSEPALTAADLIAQATEPCHHKRPARGPCPICLEDIIDTINRSLLNVHADDMESLRDQWHEDAEAIGEERDEANKHAQSAEEALTNMRKLAANLQEQFTSMSEATAKFIQDQVEEIETLIEDYEAETGLELGN